MLDDTHLLELPSGDNINISNFVRVLFEVESLEAFRAHLAKFGLKFSEEPHLKPDGSGFAFIDAPEGYEIELMQRGKDGGQY